MTRIYVLLCYRRQYMETFDVTQQHCCFPVLLYKKFFYWNIHFLNIFHLLYSSWKKSILIFFNVTPTDKMYIFSSFETKLLKIHLIRYQLNDCTKSHGCLHGNHGIILIHNIMTSLFISINSHTLIKNLLQKLKAEFLKINNRFYAIYI